MKKGFLIFVTILLTAAMLVACGRPKGMTQKTYDFGLLALEIMEKYNDMEISAAEAELRLSGIQKDVDREGEELTDTLEHSTNYLVSTNIYLFRTSLKGYGVSTYTIEEDMRNILKKR